MLMSSAKISGGRIDLKNRRIRDGTTFQHLKCGAVDFKIWVLSP